MKRLTSFVILLAGAAWIPHAHAAQGCGLNSSGGTLVDFGVYNALAGMIDATGTLTLTCTTAPPLNLPVTYGVSISAGGSNNFNQRLLGHQLKYNLYTDATRLAIWGDGMPGNGTARQAGTCGGVCSLTVYGRLPGGQAATTGTYNDQVVVTVDF